MVDLYLGKKPDFIKGYNVEDSKMTVNCTSKDETYTIDCNDHNIALINKRMEQQVLDVKPIYKTQINLLHIMMTLETALTLIGMNMSLLYEEYDISDRLNVAFGLVIAIWSYTITSDINRIKLYKYLLKSYKKYLYFIKNKKSFIRDDALDLDDTYIKINDIDELSLTDLQEMVEGPIKGR